MYLFSIINLSFADDIFDLVDKKAKVSQSAEDYYLYELHHDSPGHNNSEYIYGYYVYEPGRRDEVVKLIEKTVSTVNKNHTDWSCERFDIAYFFVKNEIISSFSFPTSIVKTEDDFYLFVCSDCEQSEYDQLKPLYTQVLKRSCTLADNTE